MEGIFHAARLGPADARRAYGLVQFFDPALRIEDWLAFIGAEGGSGTEFLAIEDARGYAHAVFSHRVEHDLRRGRVVRLTAIACSGLPSRLLHDAIFETAERLAREAGCRGIVLELSEVDAPGAWEASCSLEASVNARFDRISSLWFRPLAYAAS